MAARVSATTPRLKIGQRVQRRCGRLKATSTSRASILGVGGPEVAVIGIVALGVFGPKGLAQLARNAGKTVRAFQPTIKELQKVSREFRDTLEQELTLEEDESDAPERPLTGKREKGEAVTEEMRKASEEEAWKASEERKVQSQAGEGKGRWSRPPPSEEEVLKERAPGSSLPDLSELERIDKEKGSVEKDQREQSDGSS